MTTLSAFASSLKNKLTAGSYILTDSSDVKFKEALARWSNLDVQVPGAIVKPATEQDVVGAVKAAVQASVPFVPASGGHSQWSTIGSEGFILDLSLLKTINVDAESRMATVESGVLMKELMVALAEAGQCTPLGDSNAVGVIPYAVGGGTSLLLTVLGYACYNIVSARVITATGEVVEVNEHQQPDLFWAIKGAGHFFGVITSLTLRTYPLSVIGNPKGEVWRGFYAFPLERAEEICNTMVQLMHDEQNLTVGYVMLIAPPPAFKPILAVSGSYLGALAKGPVAFQALADLGPLMSQTSTVAFPNWADALSYVNAKGDFKRFRIAAGQTFSTKGFLKLVNLYTELLTACPDATGSGVYYKWHSPASKTPFNDSAFGNDHIYQWMDIFSWYTDPQNHARVEKWENDSFNAMDKLSNYYWYGNCDRTAPIEKRFLGMEKLARLRALKKTWDPTGVFTKQLL